MIKIAILGFGNIGGGIADVIEMNKDTIAEELGEEVYVKYLLDLRDFPDSPYADRVVKNIDVILNDPEISVVAETMGGVHPAADFSEACLRAGKSVVTSNKAVVADCGDRLLKIAAENCVKYIFEASVGGGIPIISPIIRDLTSNKIESVRGILNGTTNYILTEMTSKGRSYADVLAEAQALGYAEKDPTADVGGFDTARKIIILAALAWGRLATLDDVKITGITEITEDDIKEAAGKNCKIKLIAEASMSADNKLVLSVAPRTVKSSSLLYSVDGVFNAVEINGNAVGRLVFYGSGAGKLPTASAVVADIIEVSRRRSEVLSRLEWTKLEPGMSDISSVPSVLSYCE
ncbi:MAG: homoserine dehydrogenase [Clostridia bacterium]|nr:homoserine dehydrogenase [Clostridia bacterium]